MVVGCLAPDLFFDIELFFPHKPQITTLCSCYLEITNAAFNSNIMRKHTTATVGGNRQSNTNSCVNALSEIRLLTCLGLVLTLLDVLT